MPRSDRCFVCKDRTPCFRQSFPKVRMVKNQTFFFLIAHSISDERVRYKNIVLRVYISVVRRALEKTCLVHFILRVYICKVPFIKLTLQRQYHRITPSLGRISKLLRSNFLSTTGRVQMPSDACIVFQISTRLPTEL